MAPRKGIGAKIRLVRKTVLRATQAQVPLAGRWVPLILFATATALCVIDSGI
jgi:hypothetical protein